MPRRPWALSAGERRLPAAASPLTGCWLACSHHPGGALSLLCSFLWPPCCGSLCSSPLCTPCPLLPAATSCCLLGCSLHAVALLSCSTITASFSRSTPLRLLFSPVHPQKRRILPLYAYNPSQQQQLPRCLQNMSPFFSRQHGDIFVEWSFPL